MDDHKNHEELEWLAGRKYIIGENIVTFDSFVDAINKSMGEGKNG